MKGTPCSRGYDASLKALWNARSQVPRQSREAGSCMGRNPKFQLRHYRPSACRSVGAVLGGARSSRCERPIARSSSVQSVAPIDGNAGLGGDFAAAFGVAIPGEVRVCGRNGSAGNCPYRVLESGGRPRPDAAGGEVERVGLTAVAILAVPRRGTRACNLCSRFSVCRPRRQTRAPTDLVDPAVSVRPAVAMAVPFSTATRSRSAQANGPGARRFSRRSVGSSTQARLGFMAPFPVAGRRSNRDPRAAATARR